MPPKLVVGLMGSSVANGASLLSTPAGMKSFLAICSRHNIHELDTARVYAAGGSEAVAGQVGAASSFALSTKAPAFAPQSLRRDAIIANFDIYYLHGPDRTTPLEEQCAAINQLYSEGKFARFGVSNISPEEVQQIHDICSREGYCLPKVYQGGYNPIGRGPEDGLFPLLRKLDMNFYAFSPLGGGLLAKPLQELVKPAKGTRFDEMKVFGDIYLTEEIMGGLRKVQAACDEADVKLMEATMRWFRWHSVLGEGSWGEGNGVIVGASSEAQLEGSLGAWEKGRLPDNIAEAWEELFQELIRAGMVPRFHN
ncbi:Aflatoxin B1 aldehyde member 3 [Cyphellophora attinorum]|uniref:Aflatoxin B1 aldehyde member 3 n=1 Tax=Cyphellophora attinorum TaxID=1664694 RepID=A0A0N0NLK1_9EURO|nr:Aflatoxin B1 aldehyde member 3 [Phialophora attinorum]KPI39401.1 Aflatoxin B1 aldehyde member 3 [Phialophora attinorum]